VSISILDEGGTVGTLLKVIGLRWDLVRLSAEERSPDFSSPGAGGASAGGVGTGYRVWWCDKGTRGLWFDKPWLCRARVSWEGLGEARVGCFDRAGVLSRKSFR
jgi:hypothetical protein